MSSAGNYIYFDITIGGKDIGRVVFELFPKEAPKACENFTKLATLEKNGYKSTYFHRIIKNFCVQGGDIEYAKFDNDKVPEYPSKELGKGGKSIFNNGEAFEDENLIDLDKSFMLCMANSGPATNKSQFFITAAQSVHLNGKHTVFGKVIKGKSTIRTMEKVETIKGSNVPTYEERVVIANCGIWDDSMGVPVYNCSYSTIGRDHYEEYPDDNEDIDLEDVEKTYRIVVLIKESGTLLFKEKKLQEAYFKWIKAARYVTELIPDVDSNKKYYEYFQEMKKKIYLNLSLVTLQLQDYKQTLKYCNFILADDGGKTFKNMTAVEQNKVIYRMAMAHGGLKDYDSALNHLILIRDESSATPDPAVLDAIEKFTKLQKDVKASQQKKFASFFG